MNTEIKQEKVEAGEVLAGVLLCPFGEWPNGGQTQICDSKAFVLT